MEIAGLNRKHDAIKPIAICKGQFRVWCQQVNTSGTFTVLKNFARFASVWDQLSKQKPRRRSVALG
jgi:hypothetical protein